MDNSNLYCNVIYTHSSDKYADIAGKYKIFGKEYTLHMSIKLINEKEWREYHNCVIES